MKVDKEVKDLKPGDVLDWQTGRYTITGIRFGTVDDEPLTAFVDYEGPSGPSSLAASPNARVSVVAR